MIGAAFFKNHLLIQIEEYDEYLFTIIDGVSYEDIKIGEKERNNKTDYDQVMLETY